MEPLARRCAAPSHSRCPGGDRESRQRFETLVLGDLAQFPNDSFLFEKYFERIDSFLFQRSLLVLGGSVLPLGLLLDIPVASRRVASRHPRCVTGLLHRVLPSRVDDCSRVRRCDGDFAAIVEAPNERSEDLTRRGKRKSERASERTNERTTEGPWIDYFSVSG